MGLGGSGWCTDGVAGSRAAHPGPDAGCGILDDLGLSSSAGPDEAHRLVVKLAAPGAAARAAAAASVARASDRRPKPLGGSWYLLRGAPGTLPVSARQLRRHSVVPASSPEGTDRWFQLDVTTPTRVAVTAGMRTARSGVLRGDIGLALYDASLGRLDVADARSGAGKETVRAVVDDDVFVRVRNLEDTRWPRVVNLGPVTPALTRGSAPGPPRAVRSAHRQRP